MIIAKDFLNRTLNRLGIACFVLVVIFIYNATAQTSSIVDKSHLKEDWYIGIEGGLALSNMALIKEEEGFNMEYNFKEDVNIGITLEYFFDTQQRNISLETGLFYINKGFTYGEYYQIDENGDRQTIPEEVNPYLDYTNNWKLVQLPIKVKYYQNIAKNLNVILSGGGYVGLLTEYAIDNGVQEEELFLRVGNSYEVGLTIGTGLDYRVLDYGYLGLQYNYQFGILLHSEVDQENQSHIINVYYKIPL